MDYYYYYGGGRRSPSSSAIFDNFTLYPLPYPVLLILTVVMLLLGLSWFLSYESIVEATEEQMNWVLLVAPVLLLLAIRWLSSVENPGGDFLFLFGLQSPYDRRRGGYFRRPEEGSSPWGVAALVLLLLVLVFFHSTFRDMWLI